MSDHPKYSQTPPNKSGSRFSGSQASAARSSSTLSPFGNSKALVLHSPRPRDTPSSEVSAGTRGSSASAPTPAPVSAAQQSPYTDRNSSHLHGVAPQNYFTSGPGRDDPRYIVAQKVETVNTHWLGGEKLYSDPPSVRYNSMVVRQSKLDPALLAELNRLRLEDQQQPSNAASRVLSDYDDAQSALSRTSQSHHHQRGADGVPLSTVAPRHSVSQASGPSRRARKHVKSRCVFANTEMAR